MSYSLRILPLCGLVISLSACAEFIPVQESQFDSNPGALHAEAMLTPLDPVQIVNLASDQYLEDVVGLSGTLADRLVHLRLGPDRVAGTSDDAAFTAVHQLLEVDGFSWGSMHKLFTAAYNSGWLPAFDEIMGAWDQVWFTGQQAEHVLRFANQLTLGTLDHDLGIDARAAESIVKAQPIANLDELAGLYFVGASTLNKLKHGAAQLVSLRQDVAM